MILYFTGTGNSEFVAKTMAKDLEDTVVDVAQLIKKGEHPTFVSETPYIFVSPVYAWRFPRLFERWLYQCRFEGNRQAYFVLTCGDSIGAASNYVKKMAKKAGFDYMGTAAVVMPENYIVMFQAPSQEEEPDIIEKGEVAAHALCQYIGKGLPFETVKNTFAGHLCSDLVTPMFYTFYIGAKKFYTTDACISCGKCRDDCMLNNIALVDNKPVWGKNCTHCMSCISKCPKAAIEYGKHTKGLRRYTFPKQHPSGE